jgi:hypothetical protein
MITDKTVFKLYQRFRGRSEKKQHCMNHLIVLVLFKPTMALILMKQFCTALLLMAGLFLSPECFPQLIADAGNDTAFCASNWEEASLGGKPSAYGGTEPYTYAWSAEYEYAGRIYTASFMLADTTVANPVFTSPFNDSATFYLTVTDSDQVIAIDSITIRFSQYTVCTGDCYHVITIGDSVKLGHCISGGIPPFHYSWTPEESLSDPDSETPWAKPLSNTHYELVYTDSIGCQVKWTCEVVLNKQVYDFAPIGAQWYYGNRENPLGGPEAGYLLVESVRDTVISEQAARILTKTYHASDGSIKDEGIELVFNQGNKVFYMKGDQPYLLYDFTAETGDTLEFREPFYSTQNPDTTFTMVVDSTDFISIEGIELKRIYLRDIAWHWDLYSTHIERIGNIPYMFPQIGLQCDAACYDPFRCYSDQNIYYKPLSYDCDRLVTGTDDHHLTEHIRIYPNPASNVVNFSFKHPYYANSILQLFSVDGKMVSEVVVCEQNISVDITEFKQGVYFYNWFLLEKEVKVGKFIVE